MNLHNLICSIPDNKKTTKGITEPTRRKPATTEKESRTVRGQFSAPASLTSSVLFPYVITQLSTSIVTLFSKFKSGSEKPSIIIA